ncbi:hypothetical protein TNIN_112951 [Trichonephila inaurata madagascariensis]|uniref:Uncharacterized protein n=1 Tax=Trichonephila inaurata madagascariensis TaxID=2747483 RepID=A0A8X7CSS0_9ARAC|nr:hypothetical protein TNIN_112951 [Trichonephila inaurata madagascariensis]
MKVLIKFFTLGHLTVVDLRSQFPLRLLTLIVLHRQSHFKWCYILSLWIPTDTVFSNEFLLSHGAEVSDLRIGAQDPWM